MKYKIIPFTSYHASKDPEQAVKEARDLLAGKLAVRYNIKEEEVRPTKGGLYRRDITGTREDLLWQVILHVSLPIKYLEQHGYKT